MTDTTFTGFPNSAAGTVIPNAFFSRVLPEISDPAAGDGLVFDPSNVTAGIECSEDPILHARSGAYSVSYARRTS